MGGARDLDSRRPVWRPWAAAPPLANAGFPGHFRRCTAGPFLAMSARTFGRDRCPARRSGGGGVWPGALHQTGFLHMTALWLIVLCGLLAIAYAVWAIQSVLAAD